MSVMPQPFQRGGVRYLNLSAGPFEDVQLGTEPIVTELVLGTPQSFVMPGERILRPIRVRSFVARYLVYGNEHLRRLETERSARAPIQLVDWKARMEKTELKRFSLGVMKDQDEIGNAAPSLRIRELSAELARRGVGLDLEYRRMQLLTDPAAYPAGNVLTLAAGSEFDAPGGDSKAVIRQMARTVCAGTMLQPEDLVVYLPHDSYQAALDDPVFAGKRANTTTAMPTAQDLASYWGVREVWTANLLWEDPATGEIQSMWPDAALVYYPGSGADYDTTYGEQTFAVRLRRNRGIAARPFYDESHTSWVFPWHEYEWPAITNAKCGGLIFNCAATA